MSNLKISSGVGDSKAPPLMATESALRGGAEQSIQIQADISKPATRCTAVDELIGTSHLKSGKNSAFTCRQTLWFSFFFDGTGNNLEADIGFLKHSNIAKLYNSMRFGEEKVGNYSIYIPGVATYFPAIGDDGNSTAGKVAGAMGEARINFALTEMDKRLHRHLELARAPSNAINEINVAVFGFSRGAALARAFVNKLVETRCKVDKKRFSLASGNWPVRIRFMGLFDTVASVGRPMSSKTTDTWGAWRSDVARIIEQRLQSYKATRPQVLAFASGGMPGADPAPESSHGHDGYGGNLAINEGVEEVRHFIAAHEMRNSFPLDSVSRLIRGRVNKPGHFYETVYPGVHSDVGGSYAPDEGGKSRSSPEKFGVIPLTHMYQHAIRAGVPLLNPGAWTKDNKEDFAADATLTATYDYYLKMINAPGTLGQVINNHMHLYYAWRFRSIRLKRSGDKSEAGEIATASSKFKSSGVPIDGKLAVLQAKVDAADMRITDLQNEVREYEMDGENDTSKATVQRLKGDLQEARARHEVARQNFLKEKSCKDALPDMNNFQTLLDLYDRQLMLDVQAILNVLDKKSNPANNQPAFTRADLRPHYRLLVEAYEAEFIHHKGLTDKTIIHFFDEYIHDSLAGFGSDATIPSDPRVVYLGGDEKLVYASLATDESDAQLA
jgi:hypothetical protein